MIDLRPATDELTRIVRAIRDEQLSEATPCAGTDVAALLDHVDGLSVGLARTARKQFADGGSQPPSADAARLGPGWRDRITDQLADLAQAWREPSAWTGMTQAGGVQLPGDVAGAVTVDEVIVHGWDLAVATGQLAGWPDDLIEAASTFARMTAEHAPSGTTGLFGPPVPVPDRAPALDRLLGLTGRDPRWTPVHA
jgi:uncharacterized protein (TIGR03086 family)